MSDYFTIYATTSDSYSTVREAYGENAQEEEPVGYGCWNLSWEMEHTPEEWEAAWKILEHGGGSCSFVDRHEITWEVEMP